MKMKYNHTIIIFLIASTLIITSCTATHNKYYGTGYVNSNRLIRTYQTIGVGTIPALLTFNRDHYYNYYDNTTNYNEVGSWEIKTDTISLFPRFAYYKNHNKRIVIEDFIKKFAADSIIDLCNIPKQFLIKQDSLIEITDYTPFFKQLGSKPTPLSTTYRLLKK